jgi:cytochrome c2
MQKTVSLFSVITAAGILSGCAQEAPPATQEARDAAADAAATAQQSAESAQDTAVAAAGGNALLGSGDPEAGKRIYIFCQSCHTINEGGANKVGPNLYGIVGATAAQVDGFVYSEALTGANITWTPEALDEWIAAPSQMVAGTTMIFAGIRDPQQRADLIAYLESASDAQ